MSKLSRDIDSTSAQRNRVVHDPHLMKKGEGTLHRFQVTADRTLHFGFVPSEIEHVRTVGAKIINVMNQYRAWSQKLMSELPTFSRTEFLLSPGIGAVL